VLGFTPENAANKGAANGYAGLDGTSKVPAAQLPGATGSAAGTMSAADKTKLDGVAAGANLYVHPNHTGDVTSLGDGAQTIAANAVTNAKLATMPARTLKGNATAATAAASDLSPAQINAMLSVWGGRLAAPLILP
jgi:hypothetical protein